ncbi:ice-binding family protein [Paraglaciecola sp. MB-3u-78]|uniref:ice-binding family protein n=1 Tax=Paraglaciecola sp. MB-3u-78 TaxID=2058332 RepID=UPI000C343D8C|nr:ice-binding family protein [Paraglaciecola sp. MB-3u-78]PKH00899.1 hypothetical protein CXF95_01425 [Paraglaciecola sp. MB-3u-78]
MKNIVLKTCLTALALSVAGLANAEDAGGPVTIFSPQLISHAAISGAAISIAADSVIDGNLAAQAAVTIGAGLNTQTQHIYAGAAVTTGALSTVKNIFSGAAAGIGASAHAQNVHAGAAITVGAGGDVYQVYAGAAITLGAGASTYPGALGANANRDSTALEDIHNATSMAAAIAQIGVAQDALSTLNNSTTNPPESLYTTMGGFVSLEPGVHQGSAVSIAANSIVEFSADNFSDDPMDHVWVINLSEALTVGAGTVFVTDVPEGDTATIIWNVGAAVTLGAGTEFIGTAFVGGAFGAATSNVSCGNVYATGAVSVGSIGALLDGTSDPVACDTNAEGLAGFRIDNNGYSFASVNTVCPVWSEFELNDVDTDSLVFTTSETQEEGEVVTTYKVVTKTANGENNVTFTTTSTPGGNPYDGKDVSYEKSDGTNRQYSVDGGEKTKLTAPEQHECYEQMSVMGETYGGAGVPVGNIPSGNT